jgi:hypothetical protein
MRRRSTFAAIGGFQPFLFAIGMYFAALFFSIFICSAIFHAINSPATAKGLSDKESKTASVASNQQVLLTVAK